MLDVISVAETFVAFFTASGVGKTGLTVTVDVYAPGGTLLVADGSATPIGGGFYDYVLASGSTGTAGSYRAVFKTTDTTVDQKQVPSLYILGKAWVASHPSAAPNASGGILTVGTSSGQINPSGGKVPSTLAAADVSGNVPSDLQTIKTQAVTAAAGVTFPASLGTSTFNPASSVPVRNQDAVTSPTYNDAFQGAWSKSFAKENVDDALGQYVIKLPDNSGPARTFALTYTVTTNPNGSPIARS